MGCCRASLVREWTIRFPLEALNIFYFTSLYLALILKVNKWCQRKTASIAARLPYEEKTSADDADQETGNLSVHRSLKQRTSKRFAFTVGSEEECLCCYTQLISFDGDCSNGTDQWGKPPSTPNRRRWREQPGDVTERRQSLLSKTQSKRRRFLTPGQEVAHPALPAARFRLASITTTKRPITRTTWPDQSAPGCTAKQTHPTLDND